MPKGKKYSSDSASGSLYDSSKEKIQVTVQRKKLKKVRKRPARAKSPRIRFAADTKTDDKSKKQTPIISLINKKALIEAEIDKYPFDFKFEHGRTQEWERSQSEDEVEEDEDEYLIFDDIYKYQQLPDMSDVAEGFIGFVATAFAVSFLISISCVIAVSVEFVTFGFTLLSEFLRG